MHTGTSRCSGSANQAICKVMEQGYRFETYDRDVGSCSSGCFDVVWSGQDCDSLEDAIYTPAEFLDGSCKALSTTMSATFECTDNRTGVIVGIVIGALCFLGELLAMLTTPRPTTWKQHSPPPSELGFCWDPSDRTPLCFQRVSWPVVSVGFRLF